MKNNQNFKSINFRSYFNSRFYFLFSRSLLVFLFSIFYFLFSALASASITDGTIDSTYKYAWSENAGWINFGAPEGDVHVVDLALTGYAWAENVGWISLNCSNDLSCGTVDYEVSNDGEGNLSGYAWAENVGWINFNPTYGGVTINSSGEFLGYAWGENIGWIVFNCSTTNSCATVNYKVATDWRLRSVRPQCNNALDDDGDGKIDYPTDAGCSSLTDNTEADGGGGMPPAGYAPPASPAPTPENPLGKFRVLINNDAQYTDKRVVSLALGGGPDAKKMAISNFADFRDSGQENYQPIKTWFLTEGEGVKAVYVKFYTLFGQPSSVISDSIIYGVSPAEIPAEAGRFVPPEVERFVSPEVERPPIIIKPPAKKPPVIEPARPPIERAPEEIKIPFIKLTMPGFKILIFIALLLAAAIIYFVLIRRRL